MNGEVGGYPVGGRVPRAGAQGGRVPGWRVPGGWLGLVAVPGLCHAVPAVPPTACRHLPTDSTGCARWLSGPVPGGCGDTRGCLCGWCGGVVPLRVLGRSVGGVGVWWCAADDGAGTAVPDPVPGSDSGRPSLPALSP